MNMNRIRLVGLLSALAMLGACDDEAYRSAVEPAPSDMPGEEIESEPQGEESSQTDTIPAPPVDQSQLPPPPETSEETVQPESETLFY